MTIGRVYPIKILSKGCSIRKVVEICFQFDLKDSYEGRGTKSHYYYYYYHYFKSRKYQRLGLSHENTR